MAINMYNIKKWSKMMTGRSILHVNQGIGKKYDKEHIAGYYNDLSEKVTRANLEDGELPISSNEKNKGYYFPIAIFQYGLGAYDLYLQTDERRYLDILVLASDWAIDNQREDGGWRCFFDNGEKNEYSSMCQGEGISLLARAYIQTKEKKYLDCAKRAFSCMITPVNKGGTIEYTSDGPILKEFANSPAVLNGWIFSIFGLYDYILLVPEEKRARKIYRNTIMTLSRSLSRFDLGFWSKYDIEQKVASPFYHKLHINLLDVLYDLTEEMVFKKYSNKFSEYERKRSNRVRAFLKKSVQKIKE